MCLSQCCNKVDGKPSPATAGSRATLHRFFLTPDKTQEPKSAIDDEDKDNESRKEEGAIGEAIDNALNQGADEDDKEESEPEDLGTAAKAVCIEEQVENQRRIDTIIRRDEILLRRAQKARR